MPVADDGRENAAREQGGKGAGEWRRKKCIIPCKKCRTGFRSETAAQPPGTFCQEAIFEQLFQEVWEKLGKDGQILKCVEEMAELSSALMHWRHDKVTGEEVAEEIADVLIMAHQMRMLFGRSVVDEMVTRKLERFRERLGLISSDKLSEIAEYQHMP